MKPVHFLAFALLALVVGCKATQTLHSGGIEDAEEPRAEQQAPPKTEEAADTGGETPAATTDGGDTGAKAPDVKVEAGLTADSFVGEYSGKIAEDTIAFFKQLAPEGERAKVEEQMRSVEIALELKKGGAYTLSTKADRRADTESGTWTYDPAAGTVTLTVPEPDKAQTERLRAQGLTDEQIAATRQKSVPCKVSDNGRTLTFEQQQGGMKHGITFTKT